MYRKRTLSTGALSGIMSLEEAKEVLHIQDTNDSQDVTVQILLDAALNMARAYVNQPLMEEQIEIETDEWSTEVYDYIGVPKGCVLVSVKAVYNLVETDVKSSFTDDCARGRLYYVGMKPSYNFFRIVVKMGAGNAANVSPVVKGAVAEMLKEWYDKNIDVVDMSSLNYTMPKAAQQMLSRMRKHAVGSGLNG